MFNRNSLFGSTVRTAEGVFREEVGWTVHVEDGEVKERASSHFPWDTYLSKLRLGHSEEQRRVFVLEGYGH